VDASVEQEQIERWLLGAPVPRGARPTPSGETNRRSSVTLDQTCLECDAAHHGGERPCVERAVPDSSTG
jgi:hypothetical protein